MGSEGDRVDKIISFAATFGALGGLQARCKTAYDGDQDGTANSLKFEDRRHQRGAMRNAPSRLSGLLANQQHSCKTGVIAPQAHQRVSGAAHNSFRPDTAQCGAAAANVVASLTGAAQ